MTSDNTEKKIDLTPPTDEQAQTWFENLSDSDKQIVRNQQMVNKLTNKQQNQEPEWSRMGDGEFLRERMKRYGF
jgi:hypothetical protein